LKTLHKQKATHEPNKQSIKEPNGGTDEKNKNVMSENFW
jgi:hypothetical protein